MGWEEFGNAYLPMAPARHIWFLNCFRTNDPLSSACCCWVSHCLPCEFYTCWCWRCGRQRQNKHIIKYGRVSMSLCHSSQTRSHPALFLCHSCDLITLWWHFMSASHDLDGVIVGKSSKQVIMLLSDSVSECSVCRVIIMGYKLKPIHNGSINLSILSDEFRRLLANAK